MIATVFAVAFGIVSCGDKVEIPTDGAGEVAGETLDAPALYQVQCSMCHGVDGDGKGIVVMDRPARSFKKGAFSFGNTPEALFRTISNGIGGTPMPGFKKTLSEQERRALAAYVIELGPEQAVVVPGASELHVTDKPLVIRGGLPPIADGLAPVTRGLLVGGLDGLTFEYNAKPLVLLGVRQGGFVDRKDWGGRGGAELQPLGVVSHVVDGGGSSFMWMESASDGSWTPLEARLIATEVSEVVTAEVSGAWAWVEYDLPKHKVAGSEFAFTMRETGEAVSVAGWPGFRRIIQTSHVEGFGALRMAHLDENKVVVVAEGAGGRLLRRKGEAQLATFYVEHAVLKLGHNSTLWVDTLYGLKPTEENLKGLKELVQ